MLTAPINLISVGAFVERGMSCLFSLGGITKVFFPGDHPALPGLVFKANVSNCLSFLKLDFIQPIAVTHPAVSFVSSDYSFPHLKPDLMLWHHQFRHIGMDATRAALTKDYITGVVYEGSLVHKLSGALSVKVLSIPTLTMDIGLLVLANFSTWTYADLTQPRHPTERGIFIISLTTSPILDSPMGLN